MPIRYTLHIAEPHTHYLEVQAEIPAAGCDHIELMMPVWTPGSYLVREFARQLEAFHTAGAWRKTRKNRWLVETLGRETVTITYRLYCHELSVRTNWVDAAFALLNPAATFLTRPDLLAQPHEFRITHPYGGLFTALPKTEDGFLHAVNFDELVDSPVYLGSPDVHDFTVEGKPHFLIHEGASGSWTESARAEAAVCVHRIVEQYQRMMGGLPYERYLFLNLIVESGGGLEHKNSTVLMTSRWAWDNTAPPKPDPRETPKPSRHSWLDLASHEFFHAWNVKRLRPKELGPFDYEHENYTESLWFAEGVTTYYGPLMVRRAGLISDEAFLQDLSRTIALVQTAPGRDVQPLAHASFDAWIKFYRPHENSANATISYYTKGCLVAWLLDVRLRRATDGARSLDHLVRLAFERFPQGFTPAEIFTLFDEVAGSPVDARALVETTSELDYSEALAWFGLHFLPPPEPKRWLGATTKSDQGRLMIDTVVRAGPAATAGINAGDELIAIAGFRATADNLEQILAVAGDTTVIVVARRGRLIKLTAKLREEPRRIWQLEPDPAATEEQRKRYAAWLQSH